jgi:hypothetical protein
MEVIEPRHERRARDRSQGIALRRRLNQRLDPDRERRRTTQYGIDIASALELHLDQCTTRRAMLALLESWASEAKNGEQDGDYLRAVERAMEVMKAAPDPLSAIAVLQRRDDS